MWGMTLCTTMYLYVGVGEGYGGNDAMYVGLRHSEIQIIKKKENQK